MRTQDVIVEAEPRWNETLEEEAAECMGCEICGTCFELALEAPEERGAALAPSDWTH